MSDTPTVLTARDGDIFVVTINRSGARNAGDGAGAL